MAWVGVCDGVLPGPSGFPWGLGGVSSDAPPLVAIQLQYPISNKDLLSSNSFNVT